MKPYKLIAGVVILTSLIAVSVMKVFARQQPQAGYKLEHERDIAKNEPGPHDGTGTTTAYSFFANTTNSKLVFRKRVLHPGASIGYHLQKEEEIYYVVSGTGEMAMNNEKFAVHSGDAILTLPGSSHGLKQTGKDDLVILVNYQKTNN
jgi:mannose-6-phosphate isomerase-like protein (cupin superfamily)